MDENTPPPVTDDLTQAADGASQQLDGAIDSVTNATDGLGQMVEDGITQVEEKIDGFMSGLDNFLGKF
jgi:hypothetical protein